MTFIAGLMTGLVISAIFYPTATWVVFKIADHFGMDIE